MCFWSIHLSCIMDNHSFTTGSLPAMKSLLILQEVLFRIQGSSWRHCNADILFCLGAFLYDKDKHDHSQYFFFNLPEQKGSSTLCWSKFVPNLSLYKSSWEENGTDSEPTWHKVSLSKGPGRVKSVQLNIFILYEYFERRCSKNTEGGFNFAFHICWLETFKVFIQTKKFTSYLVRLNYNSYEILVSLPKKEGLH